MQLILGYLKKYIFFYILIIGLGLIGYLWFSRDALTDTDLKKFEPLIKNGKITVNEKYRIVENIDWKKLSDDEVDLLFTSDYFIKLMDEVVKSNNIKTSPAAMMAYTGQFKRIMQAYVKAKYK